ncbi:MAG TPA: cupin domain-containing protein [bacterium]|nr:cupin domain-containing protein [bacterium]
MAEPKEVGTGTLSNLTTYEKWIQEEGIPIHTGFFVEDLRTLGVEPWERKGGLGAYINLEGTGQTNDAYVCEIPPGGSLKPQRHLFEELIFVLSGRGATTVWQEGGKKLTFEWQAGSLFSPPINTWHQHFNGQGNQPARYVAVTTAPTMINLLHNKDFIYNNPFEFRDRFSGEDDYFSGHGVSFPGRVWDTNFVADVTNFKLTTWLERGAGGTNVMFELANNTMAAHISEFPVGTYKKGHRHGPGAHVFIIGGKGYSLLWQEGQEMTKIDWKVGSLFVPPERWFHQHFNSGAEPARYLALRWGSRKFRRGEEIARGRDVTNAGKTETSVKLGGDQIEYNDEDPRVLQIFKEECAKSGAQVDMGRFFKKK